MRIPALVRVIVLFTAVIAIGIAGFVYFTRQGDVQDAKKPLEIGFAAATGPEQTGITVQGTGEIRVEPDTAFISVGAEHIAETAGDATAALTETSNAVIDAVKAMGVADKDVATQSLTLTPIYEEEEGRVTTPPKISAYRASTNVLVTVRQIDQASAVLDAALSAGANVLNSVRFGASDTAVLKQQALDAATRDAARKAETIAAALGGRLGGLIWMREESSFSPGQLPLPSFGGRAIAAEALPIETGELSITATVRANFSYE